MKKVLILAAVLGLANIANASSRYPQYPMINGISADNLCDAGASFKTINPVEVCTKWQDQAQPQSGESYQGNDLVCVSKSTQSLSVAKTYTVSTCLDAAPSNMETNYPVACQNFTTEEKAIENKISVPVIQDQGETGMVQVDTITYTIPACK